MDGRDADGIIATCLVICLESVQTNSEMEMEIDGWINEVNLLSLQNCHLILIYHTGQFHF